MIIRAPCDLQITKEKAQQPEAAVPENEFTSVITIQQIEGQSQVGKRTLIKN
jgi:hypothetical protein